MSRNSSGTLVGLSAATALVVLVGGWIIASRWGAKGKKTAGEGEGEGEQLLKLMPLEQTSLILGIPSISTVTFFEGRADVAAIKQRVRAILAANPWLSGRLVLQQDLYCCYHSTAAAQDDALGSCFTFSENAAVRSDTPYNKLIKLLGALLVKKGQACVDRDEPLFRVHLIVGEEGKEYALVVSLSHIIGDGSTFYALYGMMSHEEAVQSHLRRRLDVRLARHEEANQVRHGGVWKERR